MVREHMDTAVASSEECAEQPAHNRDNDSAEKCPPETRNLKALHYLTHELQHQRIDDQNEHAQCDENQWQAQQEQHRPNKSVDDAEQKRRAQKTAQTGAIINAHNRCGDENCKRRHNPAENEMSHAKKLFEFLITPNASEKPLANRPMRRKRIGATNTDQFVPKKNKIVQSKNQAPPEAGGLSSEVKPATASRVRGAMTSRKMLATSDKKSAASQKAKVIRMPAEAGTRWEPPDEEIRLRAYFISERRRRFALPGDAESDWLEAKRQLLSESGLR